MNDVMGGEFDIDLSVLSHNVDCRLPEGFFYSSGRSALYQILLNIMDSTQTFGGGNCIWLPEYICESVYDVVDALGLPYGTYQLSESLSVANLNFLRNVQKRNVVVLVNYFGMCSQVETINEVRKIDPNAIIIEDNVQSLFSMYNPSRSDYAFTSFRKTLPLPDGGWVKSNAPMAVIPRGNEFSKFKIAGSILKKYREYRFYEDNMYLALLRQGEDTINDDFETGISELSERLYGYINIEMVRTRRQANAAYLVEELSKIGIKPVLSPKENDVPLFLPIYVKNRDELRNALFQENIFCPVHWPRRQSSAMSKFGSDMANHELSLIIDQRYNRKDMMRMMDVIKKFYGRI